jgi:hypothetical protein
MALASERRRFLVAAAGAALATTLLAVWIGLRLGGAGTALWADDLATPLAALIACVLCFRAAGRQGGRMRAFWSLLGCALACWTLAEVIWAVYALILHREVSVPSWADVGYLSAIPLAVAALVVHPATRGSRTRKARSVFDGLVIATALLFLSWTLVLGPLWRSTDLSTWTGVVALAYPFGDVVVVFFIVLAIRGMTGAHRLSLWCLLAGLLVMALSDSAYTYMTEVANYSSSSASLIDVGWIAAYLAIALAALSPERGTAAAPGLELAGPRLGSLLSPLVPVLLALGVAAVELKLGHHLDKAAWLMACGLIALVLVRQGLLLRELLTSGLGTPARLRTRLKRTALGWGVVDQSPPIHHASSHRRPSRTRPGHERTSHERV